MSLSHLGKAIHVLCKTRRKTAREIAQSAGLHHTMLSRSANGSRLEAKSLRALCTSQPPPDGLTLLLGHLRDEIERAGGNAFNIQISVDGRELEDEIRQLAEIAKNNAQLRDVLHHLSLLVCNRLE
jgi:transcriptional regulator with XRE-family HTH domain